MFFLLVLFWLCPWFYGFVIGICEPTGLLWFQPFSFGFAGEGWARGSRSAIFGALLVLVSLAPLLQTREMYKSHRRTPREILVQNPFLQIPYKPYKSPMKHKSPIQTLKQLLPVSVCSLLGCHGRRPSERDVHHALRCSRAMASPV